LWLRLRLRLGIDLNRTVGVDEVIQRTIRAFARNYVTAHFVPDGPAALDLLRPHMTAGATVASGNSLTLRETGIFEYLSSESHPAAFINQFKPGLSFVENRARKKAGLTADVYVSSANALTEDGRICCVDGGGNRVAALLFGPEKVFVVAGRNKIVADEVAAWERIRRIASPQTSAALGRSLPCVDDGVCHDCGRPDRICRYYVTLRGQMERDKDRLAVIIIDQDLGL